jgi:hypothetical protein
MTNAPETYDLSQLEQSIAKWRGSAALRTVYSDIYGAMRANLVPGRTLEIGAGIGVARDFFEPLVTSDVRRTAYVDRQVSAYDIPPEGWSNLIAMDVLHHLQEPLRFFESASAALVDGGRIILAEPAGTAGGRCFYRAFHHEPCRPAEIAPPFCFPADDAGEFANMGMAHALFGRRNPSFEERFQVTRLKVVSVRYRDLLAYPATGGFSRPALLPASALRVLLALERCVPQALMRVLALRMIVTLEKETRV